METADLFKKVILNYLENQPRGAQKKLALRAGIDIKHLNNFLKNRRAMIEQDRIKIAKVLGMTYLEMLNLGYKLATGSEPAEPEVPIELKDVIPKLKDLDQSDLKIINELADRLSKGK